MSEAENFKSAQESRADVAARAARSSGHTDVVRRMVDAAVYRATHRAEPSPSTEPSTEDGEEEA